MNWDPAKHPRDLRGRFAALLASLKEGESVHLPDGIKVTKVHANVPDAQEVHLAKGHPSSGTFTVTGGGKRMHTDYHHQFAADHALLRSAGLKDPKSVGGNRSFDSLPAALKAHRSIARRAQKAAASKEASGKRLGRDKAAAEQKAHDAAKQASGSEARLARKAVRRAIAQRLATGKGSSDHRWKLKSADEKLRVGKMPSSFSLEERKAAAEAVQGHGGRRAHDALGIPKSKGKKGGESAKKEAGKVPKIEREQLANGRYRYTQNGKQEIAKSRVKYTHFSRHALGEGRYVHLYHKSEGAARRGKYKYGHHVHVGKIERKSGDTHQGVEKALDKLIPGGKKKIKLDGGLTSPHPSIPLAARSLHRALNTSNSMERMDHLDAAAAHLDKVERELPNKHPAMTHVESANAAVRGARADVPHDKAHSTSEIKRARDELAATIGKGSPAKSTTTQPKAEATGKVKGSAPSQQRIDAALHRVVQARQAAPSWADTHKHLTKARGALLSGNHTVAARSLLMAHHSTNSSQVHEHIDKALTYLGYRRKKKAAS